MHFETGASPVIELHDLHKSHRKNGITVTVARGLNVQFPRRGAVALLGRNGAGKSTLLRMIAGTVWPDKGEIITRGHVSWPVGFAGSFHGDLTGAQNTRFVARVYGVDSDALCDFVADFSDLGRQFCAPVRTYSSGMRSRLAFGVSMGIDFDTYLIDEVTSVGDGSFREKSEAILQDRLESASAIVVSHSLQMVARLCTHGAVLENGELHWHHDIMDAIDHHRRILAG